MRQFIIIAVVCFWGMNCFGQKKITGTDVDPYSIVDLPDKGKMGIPNGNFTFRHYPTVKEGQIAFTYSGKLAHFNTTIIELLYFKDQHLHIDKVALSYTEKGIKGRALLPENTSAFALSVYNNQVGTDDNGGLGYAFCTYRNGKPVKEALMNKSLLLTSGKLGVSEETHQKALQLQQKQCAMYPQLKQKYMLPRLQSLIRYDHENRQSIENKINALFKDSIHSDASEGSLIKMMQLYTALHRQKPADSVLQIIVNKFPDGVGAAIVELNQIKKEEEPDSMAVALRHFKKKFGQLGLKKNPFLAERLSKVYNNIAFKYFHKKEYEKMLLYLSQIPLHLLKATYLVINYNRMTYLEIPMSVSFIHDLSAQALQAIAKAKKNRPDDESPSTWKKLINDYYPSIVDIHARALAMSGNVAGAIDTEKSILSFNSGYTGNFNRHYLDYISRSGNNDKFLSEARDIYVQNKSCPGIDSILKVAYHESTGSSDVKYLAFKKNLDSLARGNRIKALEKEMLQMEAPLFTLKDLDGKEVALHDLRGKVVVLDFWATWCRPCIESFKGMKRLKDKYKSDDEVVFLFIDEDDPQPNESSRIKKINDFLQGKGYRFRVLLDNKGKNSVQRQYLTTGIPVKVVIDRNGVMQFKSIGYSGDLRKLVKQMETKINVLREE